MILNSGCMKLSVFSKGCINVMRLCFSSVGHSCLCFGGSGSRFGDSQTMYRMYCDLHTGLFAHIPVYSCF